MCLLVTRKIDIQIRIIKISISTLNNFENANLCNRFYSIDSIASTPVGLSPLYQFLPLSMLRLGILFESLLSVLVTSLLASSV